MSRALVQLNGALTTSAGFYMFGILGGVAAYILVNWALVVATQKQMNDKVSFVGLTGLICQFEHNNHTVNV